MTWLVFAFFITALLYAMAGLGGGSTYSALLVLSEVDYRVLPTIALGCNIIVTASCSVQFARHGYVPWRGLLPILATSMPMAFIGGLLPVQKWMFTLLLGVALLVSGVLMITQDLRLGPTVKRSMRSNDALVHAGIGGGIGLLAGIVGIGGGIFSCADTAPVELERGSHHHWRVQRIHHDKLNRRPGRATTETATL